MRIKATDMVGVSLTSSEVRRLLDALTEGELGSLEEPELTSLRRKLAVMLHVTSATEQRRGGA